MIVAKVGHLSVCPLRCPSVAPLGGQCSHSLPISTRKSDEPISSHRLICCCDRSATDPGVSHGPQRRFAPLFLSSSERSALVQPT